MRKLTESQLRHIVRRIIRENGDSELLEMEQAIRGAMLSVAGYDVFLTRNPSDPTKAFAEITYEGEPLGLRKLPVPLDSFDAESVAADVAHVVDKIIDRHRPQY